jgi:hypothetical protein
MKRIAFVGDSITQGFGGIENQTLRKEGEQGYLTNGVKIG